MVVPVDVMIAALLAEPTDPKIGGYQWIKEVGNDVLWGRCPYRNGPTEANDRGEGCTCNGKRRRNKGGWVICNSRCKHDTCEFVVRRRLQPTKRTKIGPKEWIEYWRWLGAYVREVFEDECGVMGPDVHQQRRWALNWPFYLRWHLAHQPWRSQVKVNLPLAPTAHKPPRYPKSAHT